MRLVRLLRDALVERRHDGGLLLFREALGRLFREHASIATQTIASLPTPRVGST